MRSTYLCMVPVLTAAAASSPAAEPTDTAITYQAELRNAGTPVTDLTDFRFLLFDEAVGGNQLGPTLELLEIEPPQGRITVDLDFGADLFQGDGRWLEIHVRNPAGEGQYVVLEPRQPIAPAPYALFALAGNEGPQGPPGPPGDSHWETDGSTTYFDGNVGVGTDMPLARAHVETTDMLLEASATLGEELVLEDVDSVLGLYSDASGNYGSAISLGEVDAAGGLVDKWGILRRTSDSGGGSVLRFTYGTAANYSSNPTFLALGPTGNVGVGTAAPEQKLHVLGDALVDGAIAIETTTRYLTLDASAFQYEHNSGDLSFYTIGIGGEPTLQNQNALQSTREAAASVQLPHGATITELSARMADASSSTDLRLRLRSVSFEGDPPIVTLAEVQSSGFGVVTTSLSETVDNQNFIYYLVAEFPSGTQADDLALNTIRLTYTVDAPLP